VVAKKRANKRESVDLNIAKSVVNYSKQKRKATTTKV